MTTLENKSEISDINDQVEADLDFVDPNSPLNTAESVLAEEDNPTEEPKEGGDKEREPQNNGRIIEKNKGYIISEGIRPSASNMRFGKNGTNTDAKVIMNGPLYEYVDKTKKTTRPVGGYIENGKVKQNFLTTKAGVDAKGGNFKRINGIMGYGTDGKMHMFPFSEIEEQNGNTIIKTDGTQITFNWAFQNGPMLVQEGKIPEELDGCNRKNGRRTALAFTSTGEIKCIQVENKSLLEFAKICQEQGLTNTIYMDGSPGIAGIQNGTTGKKYGNISAGKTGIQFG